MTSIEWLKWLTDKETLAIPVSTMAKYCHCSAPTISKLIHDEQQLTEKMSFLLDTGINQVLSIMKEKLGE